MDAFGDEAWEPIHDTADNIDQSISGAIVHCHRSIQMLERIHRDQIRANNPDVEQDIYGLRRSLDRFIASCNALTYMGRQVAPTFESSMACMMVARPAKKSKQIREMQEEFWDHQRLLSLALANAVFMTSLDLQRQNTIPDPTLASILRHAEKRHAVHESAEEAGRQNSKPKQSRADELEWEFCLRRYFDYLDSHSMTSKSSQSYRSDPGITRSASHLSMALSGPVRQSQIESTLPHTYRQVDQYESLNSKQNRLLEASRSTSEGQSYNEIYTRPRRKSTASINSHLSESSRTSSLTGSQAARSLSPELASRRRSRTFGTGVQWEPIPMGSSLTSDSIHQDESLGKAWNDIVSATSRMAPDEARGYIQGRLDGLDPTSNAQIRQSLSVPDSAPVNRSSPIPRQSIHAPPSSLQVRTKDGLVVARNIPNGESKSHYLNRTVSEPVPRMEAGANRIKRSPLPGQPKLSRRGSKKRLSNSRGDHTRNLSTIIERPTTAKSKASSTKSRKSIFSLKKEKPPPMPEMPQLPPGSRTSSVSESARSAGRGILQESTAANASPRIVELDEAFVEDENHGSANLGSPLDKKLPMTPGDFEMSKSTKMSRLFTFKKKKHTQLSTSASTPHLATGMRSSETVHKVSLDSLRRNGSKSTLCLVAIQEGPEQPFQVWLSALPYIEGRASSPRV